jgi:hypothetical protein
LQTEEKMSLIYMYIYTEKVFLDQKLQFTYLKTSVKNVHGTEEAFSSQKENIQHLKTRNV